MTKNPQNEGQEFQAEYEYIKKDVKKVVFINILILAILIGLFFAEKKIGVITKFSNYF